MDTLKAMADTEIKKKEQAKACSFFLLFWHRKCTSKINRVF